MTMSNHNWPKVVASIAGSDHSAGIAVLKELPENHYCVLRKKWLAYVRYAKDKDAKLLPTMRKAHLLDNITVAIDEFSQVYMAAPAGFAPRTQDKTVLVMDGDLPVFDDDTILVVDCRPAPEKPKPENPVRRSALPNMPRNTFRFQQRRYRNDYYRRRTATY